MGRCCGPEKSSFPEISPRETQQTHDVTESPGLEILRSPIRQRGYSAGLRVVPFAVRA